MALYSLIVIIIAICLWFGLTPFEFEKARKKRNDAHRLFVVWLELERQLLRYQEYERQQLLERQEKVLGNKSKVNWKKEGF